MKTIEKEVWVFLTILWGMFAVWEYQIVNLSSDTKDNSIRYDLLILPILLFITIYAVYTQKKNKR